MWLQEWWEVRREWKLSIRADCHNRWVGGYCNRVSAVASFLGSLPSPLKITFHTVSDKSWEGGLGARLSLPLVASMIANDFEC